ncbi:hypothetical protein AB0C33_01970 [Nonomuraea sp. NPDC048881]|uniref:hypothetical protein n=1 Tax=Nonomuraea sp. NPDC048881 TaxID=3155030 RepID=UPI00340931D7
MELPDIMQGDEIEILTGKATVFYALRLHKPGGKEERYLLLLWRDHPQNPFVVCYLDARGYAGKEWDHGYYADNATNAIKEYQSRVMENVQLM